MKNIFIILCLSTLWLSCEDSTEPEGETVELWGVSYSVNNTVELDLTSSGLLGEIPIEIGELINLEKLDLKNNNLTGSIPSSLSNLENLIELNLYNNELTGSIDSTITKLTNLQYLVLESNQFSGSIPEDINNLSNLIALDLRDNMFSGLIPTQISELIILEDLHLHQNQFSGIIDSNICDLVNIQFDSNAFFNIYQNQLCPPYPECIEDYIGEQDTSSCFPNGMEITEITEGELYSECQEDISNEFTNGVLADSSWEFTVHFLDENCEGLDYEDEQTYIEITGYDTSIISITIPEQDGHSYSFVLETLAPGITTFDVTLINQGYTYYTSQQIAIVVE